MRSTVQSNAQLETRDASREFPTGTWLFAADQLGDESLWETSSMQHAHAFDEIKFWAAAPAKGFYNDVADLASNLRLTLQDCVLTCSGLFKNSCRAAFEKLGNTYHQLDYIIDSLGAYYMASSFPSLAKVEKTIRYLLSGANRFAVKMCCFLLNENNSFYLNTFFGCAGKRSSSEKHALKKILVSCFYGKLVGVDFCYSENT